MSTADQVLGVIRMSFDGSYALWPVSVLLTALFVFAVRRYVSRRIVPDRAVLILCATIPFWLVLFASIAIAFPADPRSPTAIEDTEVPTVMVSVLFLAALAQAVASVGLAKHQKLAAGAIAAFGMWFVFWVSAVAAMSVSGVWL
jgi:hypothetical protein